MIPDISSCTTLYPSANSVGSTFKIHSNMITFYRHHHHHLHPLGPSHYRLPMLSQQPPKQSSQHPPLSLLSICNTVASDLLKRFYLFIFREKGREREKEGEKHLCARDIPIGCPQLRTWRISQACALTGN